MDDYLAMKRNKCEVRIYNGILLSHEKEQMWSICAMEDYLSMKKNKCEVPIYTMEYYSAMKNNNREVHI